MASQQQMAALLQALLAKGLESQEALPTLKALMEAKIFSLDQLTATNMPKSISKKIQGKILKKSRKKGQSPSAAANRKKQKTTPIAVPKVSPKSFKKETFLINRSPIKTLWGTVVARKMFSISLEEALTFGSAYASDTARAKGISLGIFTDKPSEGGDNKEDTQSFPLMNEIVKANQTPNGLRAIGNGKELDPSYIWNLLTKKLGEDLPFVLKQMEEAAEKAGDDLEATAYGYYMHIRPDIPHGTKGWGAHGYMESAKLSNYYPIDKKVEPAGGGN